MIFFLKNPPFGTKTHKGIDMVFLKKAIDVNKIQNIMIYTYSYIYI